ncbi:MAG: MBL fold metallo-hydrolase [Oscillospiraceae bacterium]|nr:MBL fold metallo-hydrolase [Oscillospiraceae bacterium]
MSRIYPLFSSSSGNSCFIGNPSEGILIDAGLNCRRLTQALLQNDIQVEAIKAIFITHDHTDHIAALKVFKKHYDIPVYASPKTMNWLIGGSHLSHGCFQQEVGEEVTVGDFSITSFKTPHDAIESVGYKIEMPDGKVCTYCTDLGHVTEEVDENLRLADLVFLESNYDENMLRNGPYPYPLKQRIAAPNGHLSNSASAKEIHSLIENGLTKVILGHLSRENNTPRIAENTLIRELGDEFKRNRDYLLYIAPIETTGMAVTF